MSVENLWSFFSEVTSKVPSSVATAFSSSNHAKLFPDILWGLDQMLSAESHLSIALTRPFHVFSSSPSLFSHRSGANLSASFPNIEVLRCTGHALIPTWSQATGSRL